MESERKQLLIRSKVFIVLAVLSIHRLDASDLEAGVVQPLHCLIIQNLQAMHSMGKSMERTAEDQGRSEGGKGAQFPRRRITMGAPNHLRGRRMTAEGAEQSQQYRKVLSSTVHLLRKHLRFEHGAVKLASCPGPIEPRNLPSGDNMVNGLFVCATLTSRRRGHTHWCKQEHKRPTSVRRRYRRSNALVRYTLQTPTKDVSYLKHFFSSVEVYMKICIAGVLQDHQ